MEDVFGFNSKIIDSVLKTTELSEGARRHVSKVYSTLALSMLVASLGAYVHMSRFSYILQGGLLTLVLSLVLLFALHYFPSVNKSDPTVSFAARELLRKQIFGAFSFFYGMSLGPFLDAVSSVDPSITYVALLLSAVVFVSFTASALFSKRRSFLFLGGILCSALGVLSILSLLNIFYHSELISDISLYGGLVVFCGYVLFDTQLLIERAEAGGGDEVKDALCFFMDAVSIFIRISIIMMKNKQHSSNNNAEDSRKRRARMRD